jgi:lysophospholipase L1-like esterase
MKMLTTHLKKTFQLALLLGLLWGATASAQRLQVDEPVRFLALGDSYTIGERVAPAERWPRQLFDSLTRRGYLTDSLRIIARTGWRTDNLAQAMAAANLDSTYSLVSLLIGVNNQYQGRPLSAYGPDFESLLQAAVGLAGGNPLRVLVLSIPDYAFTPFGQGANPSLISTEIDSFNAVNRRITDRLGVPYFDITPISREGLADPALVATDGLHPSGKMYTEWVELILKSLDEPTSILVDKPPFFFSPTSASTFSLQTSEPLQLTLWDLTGRKVFRQSGLTSGQHVLPVQEGVYLLEWQSQGGKSWRKKIFWGR